MAYEGFDRYGSGDKLWEVHHSHGSTHVRAPSEAIAIQRFLAKYPNERVKDVKYKG